MSGNWLRKGLLWIYSRLLPAILSLAALFGLWFWGQRQEQSVYDLWCGWSAPLATHSPVTLVLIDDESIARLSGRFGPMPWPRQFYLQIFQRVQAQSPAVMVFDGHFAHFSQAGDQGLFDALSRFPNLITGLALPERADRSGPLNPARPSYYHRLNPGVVSIREDADGVIRRVKPFELIQPPAQKSDRFQQSGVFPAGVFPALSTEAAYQFWARLHPQQSWALEISPSTLGAPRLRFGSEGHLSTLPGLPLAGDLSYRLRWSRVLNPVSGEYARSHLVVPVWRLFEPGAVLPAPLKGRVALIGSSSTVFRDFHRTPMAYRHLGPDIHATAIDNLLTGQAIRRASPVFNALVLVLLAGAVFGLRLGLSSLGKTLLYTTGGMVLYCWAAFWLFAHQSLWLDVVTPELFMMGAFLAGSTYRSLFKEKQLAAMEKSLTQLVDPEVLREIRRQAHVLKPGGEKLEITSMFVDIRNFTTLAERLPPQDVTALLNQFYGLVVDIVFRHQGTIDKFMGDGILIIFGAPLPDASHRVLALRAALETLYETRKLARHWQESLGFDTDIGISMNTGTAFVGFLGPADKLEYTAVGDTVNTCVRLQEQARLLQTSLLMSESTVAMEAALLSDILGSGDCLSLGEVSVRGREASIRVFTVSQALYGQPD
ncbi:adenylate/guanylate cyclase domain-containing protein [Vampirovibrio chlorellavorus]|uniref:adenylate/guanylate cyclase domain-containing protein n=1 Tax=Vampirovibrio chlorellavorus TaxID=758823 RepID=UPI0026EE61E7|nr:adenylate/guanylate cyclase domain-containing protein [Vampirovibrio chlorellavorus]